MAQRTVALCDGKYIGIETIFTVIDGKQINIPEKLKEIRQKSQNNKLFCPCGCGANLVLVAGDKNLREQHFRIKDGQHFEDCTAVIEGKTSVESKIVLKCWLDDNLHADDLESRVPICDVADSSRRYEFTFISHSHGIALNYCHNRANLSDEKQSVLEENSNGIKIIHVVDYMNGGSDGQYPEGLMKLQAKQKYCLLLSIEGLDYDAAKMKAVFYGQDTDGLWQEMIFADDLLKEYRIDNQRNILLKGKSLDALLEAAMKSFLDDIEAEKRHREEERKRRAELLKQHELELERRREEQRIQAEETAKRRAKAEGKSRIEAEKALEEKKRREEDFKKNLESSLEQQETQVRDAEGNRWIKCEYCGKIAKDAEFTSYGGKIGAHLNLGTCKECSNNPNIRKKRVEIQSISTKKYDSTVCPDCGSKLIEKNGRNGRFIGCSNFPKCYYTRSLTRY